MVIIIYWVSTLIIAVFLLVSAYTYFFSKNTISGLKELGFPDFFRIQLGVLKIIAVLVLLIPSIPSYVKEWGYAGIAFFLITAIVAHVAHRDSIIDSASISCIIHLINNISLFFMFSGEQLAI